MRASSLPLIVVLGVPALLVAAAGSGQAIRISQHADGAPSPGALIVMSPVSACAPARDEFLVVWAGLDAPAGVTRIHGQVVDGRSGERRGENVLISSPVGTGSLLPRVAHDSVGDSWLVAWGARGRPRPRAAGSTRPGLRWGRSSSSPTAPRS